LRKNGHDTEDYSYLLFFIPKEINDNGDFIFDTELVRMEVDVEHAERLFKKAVAVLEAGMPEPSDNCKFCKWNEDRV